MNLVRVATKSVALFIALPVVALPFIVGSAAPDTVAAFDSAHADRLTGASDTPVEKEAPPASDDDYWTRERMEKARPLPLPHPTQPTQPPGDEEQPPSSSHDRGQPAQEPEELR